MNQLKIVHDFKHLNLPLDMVAKNNNVSTAYVLKVLLYHNETKPAIIIDCKKLIKEIECLTNMIDETLKSGSKEPIGG